MLQSFSFAVVLLRLSHLLYADSFFLVVTVLLVSHHLLVLFLLSLHSQLMFMAVCFSVPLPNLNDFIGFFLGVFDLFPCLQTKDRASKSKVHQRNGYDLLFALLVLRERSYWREALRLLEPVYGLPSSRRERLRFATVHPSYRRIGPGLATTPGLGPIRN